MHGLLLPQEQGVFGTGVDPDVRREVVFRGGPAAVPAGTGAAGDRGSAGAVDHGGAAAPFTPGRCAFPRGPSPHLSMKVDSECGVNIN